MWSIQLLDILFRRRRLLVINTLVVTAVAAIVSFLVPQTFRARATVMPPESESPLGGLMGLTAGQVAMAVTRFSLPMLVTPSDLYAAMLQSETILRETVDSLDLQRIYGKETPWEAVSKLRDDLIVRVDPEGIIVVEVDSRDPVLSANVANLLVDRLDQLNRRLQNQKGREYSAFLAQRTLETDSALSYALEQLKNFQEQNRAIALDLQSEALISNLAEQKARLTSSEIELEIMRQTLYPNHPELLKKAMFVAETRRRLRDIEEGARISGDSILSALDIPLSRIPDLSVRFAVLKRDVKILELTYELLSQQLEMARLQERRDTPTLMRLDVARPPEQAVKPRKRIIVLVAFFASFLLTAFYAVLSDKAETAAAEGSPVFSKINDIIQQLRRKPLG